MNLFSLMFSVTLCLAVRASEFYPRVGVRRSKESCRKAKLAKHRIDRKAILRGLQR